MTNPKKDETRAVEIDLTNGKQIFELIIKYLGIEVVERFDGTNWVLEVRKSK